MTFLPYGRKKPLFLENTTPSALMESRTPDIVWGRVASLLKSLTFKLQAARTHELNNRKKNDMQLVESTTKINQPPFPATPQDRISADSPTLLAHYQIIRRNGAVVPFEPAKIAVAMMKAFLAVHGTQGAASASVRETVDVLTQAVVRALMRSRPGGGTFHIEDVQDQAELGLMRGGHHEIARAYVLYRERRT